MKKKILFLVSLMLLCGCSINDLPNDACDFLTEANWEGNDSQCVNVISFNEDGGFSNWCYCGSPVGDSDMVEAFRYRASDKTIHLLDDSDKVLETGSIQYVDDMYLIVDIWDRCYVYENMDTERIRPKSCVVEYIGTDELSKPYLQILGFENGALMVSAYDYDKDMAADFATWTLPVQKDIAFSEVIVTVENGVETFEISQLTEKEYGYIGDFYTTAYIEMNNEGEVASVIFYGEIINEF